MKYRALFPLLLLAVLLPLFSTDGGDVIRNIPKGTIKGRVADRETRAYLPGVEVEIVGLAKRTVSDSLGGFTLEGVEVGTYTLRFTLPDVKPYFLADVRVKSDLITHLEVVMDVIPFLQETITVTPGYFRPMADMPAGTVNYSSEEIRRIAGASWDLGNLLSGLASVAKAGEFSLGLVVRGGNPSENKYFIDGIEVPTISHFPMPGSSGGLIGLINVNFVQDVQFSAGGFSAPYGDALSSVMEITYRQGNADKWSVAGNVNIAGFSLSTEGPFPGRKGSYMVSWTRSYLDLLAKAFMNSSIAPRYGDVQGKIVYDFSPRTRLTILALVGDDDFNIPKGLSQDEDFGMYGSFRFDEGTVGANWSQSWSDRVHSDTSLSYSYANVRFEIRDAESDDLWYYMRNDEGGTALRHLTSWRIGPRLRLRFGADAKQFKGIYQYRIEGFTNELGIEVPGMESRLDQPAFKAGPFVDLSWSPLPRLNLNLGLRGDTFSYNSRFLLSPRLLATWTLSEKTSITSSYGIFRQGLPLALLVGGDAAKKDLEAPLCRHITAGINHLFTADTRLVVELYDKRYSHLPLNPDEPGLFLFDKVAEEAFFGVNRLVDTGSAYARGIEVTLQKKLKDKIYGMASASFFKTEYRDLNGLWHPRTFDQRFTATIEGGFRPSRTWECSLRWTYAGGRPYTPYDREASIALGQGVLDSTRINTARQRAYHALNLRLDKRFYFRRFNLTGFVTIWNVYNRKNSGGMYWNEREQKEEWFPQIPFLPLIGLQLEF